MIHRPIAAGGVMYIPVMPGVGGTVQISSHHPDNNLTDNPVLRSRRTVGYRKVANSFAALVGSVDKLNAAIPGPALCRVVRDVRFAFAKAPGMQAFRVQAIGVHQYIDHGPGALQ